MCAVVRLFAELRKTLCQGTQTNNRGIAQGKRKKFTAVDTWVFDKGGCLNGKTEYY